MFALGHVQRMKVIRKLLDGPATYQALKRLTKLKPGPLYHHVNQLRLAGLILPRQRDLYELTRAGRNMVLGMMVLEPLIHDARRRPMA
jgi:predicted transcriptional regulator